jgi:AraC-like DNA-binding protein
VTLSVDPSKGYPSSAIAKSLTSFLYWVRKLCNFNVMPLSATFSFDQPDHPDQFSATFGDDLTFFNNTNSLKFDNAHLNRKFKTSNPYIKSVLIKKITNEKNDYILNGKNDKPINKEVIYNLIEHNLKNNKANINTISSDLSISRQTLHRYLKNEGTSFKQILNDVRKDKSLRLLSNQNLTTTMVSEKLGYNEISSFYSAFKAWHGFTISDYKKTLSIE